MALSRSPDSRDLDISDHSLDSTENYLIYFHIYTLMGQKMTLISSVKDRVKSVASSAPLPMEINPGRWRESQPQQLTEWWSMNITNISASSWKMQELGNYLPSHLYAKRNVKNKTKQNKRQKNKQKIDAIRNMALNGSRKKGTL